MTSESPKYSLSLSMKQVFMAGIAAGVLVVAALGFVGMLVKGGSFEGMFAGSARRNPEAPAAPPGAPSPTDPGEQVGEVPPVTNDDHVRGDKNAPVTLIEYSDFECPFCSRFHPTMVQLVGEYKGKVRWVYRHFPLSSIHPNAQKAAEASECASEQGKFWEMADTMFAKQAQGLGAAQLSVYAKEAGVKDIKKFESCLTSGKYAARVQADQAGGEQAGVTGTPGTIVIAPNGDKQLIPGALPYESVKQVVDAALAAN